MNKKKIIIIIVSIIIIAVIGLWIGGIIPKAIAKTVATNYLKSNFPKNNLNMLELNGILILMVIQFNLKMKKIKL